MTEPNSPLPPGDIPLSDPTIPPTMGAVPGATPPPSSVPPPTMGYAPDPTGGSGGVMSPPGAYLGPAPDKDSQTMALLAHLLGIVTAFAGPLIVWLLKKDTSPFVDDQAKEALNFQLTLLIGWIVAGVLLHVMCIGLLLYPVLMLANLILSIVAASKANAGVAYRYPIALRIIK